MTYYDFKDFTENIYGYPVCVYLSDEGDSVFFVSPGKWEVDRKMLAVFSYIRRNYGYVGLLGLAPTDYLQYGYGKLEEDPNNDNAIRFVLASPEEEVGEGFTPLTYVEF